MSERPAKYELINMNSFKFAVGMITKKFVSPQSLFFKA